MVVLLRHLDDIARRQKRDVLSVRFIGDADPTDVGAIPARTAICDWLTAHGVAWRACLPVSDPDLLDQPYLGDIHIDAPHDPAAPATREVMAFLERPDGSPRFPNTTIVRLSLALAKGRR